MHVLCCLAALVSTALHVYSLLQEVEMSEGAVLAVLPFADSDRGFSFKWFKGGKKLMSRSDNKLTVENVSDKHCKGFYTCEVYKNEQPCFKVHHCLRINSRFLLYFSIF